MRNPVPSAALLRLALGAAIGVAGGVLVGLGLGHGWVIGVMAGWCLAATTVDALAWRLIWTSDWETTRKRARDEDTGAGPVWVLSIVSATGTVLSLIPLLSRAQTDLAHGWLIALCLWAAFSGWVLIHTSFALRYAHMYYRDEPEPAWGLKFPDDLPPRGLDPRDLDFAYVAFTVGVSCAISDVEVVCPQIRSAVLLHSVVSFVFNTAILALLVNLLAGGLQAS